MNAKLISGIALALGMAACATAPITNAALENARSAVRSAESDPNVNKYAALDLNTAQERTCRGGSGRSAARRAGNCPACLYGDPNRASG